ncbi:MAG TPA: ABC transporter ATP-binding protein, partial [Candidatus Paceibacterota bacterium]|nr:ABC transporter ATP-binding protein [Candidatus Paceibacterota bacterium]
MKYSLNIQSVTEGKPSFKTALKKFRPIIEGEKKNLIFAGIAILASSALTLVSPFIVGHVIDTYVVTGRYRGVLLFGGLLLVIYIAAFAASYFQTQLMGAVGQRTLFNLRNAVFRKLQELPVAFFNQNKSGDLISRINNDTDKLNQFFSQALMQFVSNAFIIVGAGIFLLSINWKLGVAALLPGLFLFIFTRAVGGWIRKKNAVSLQATGGLSAEIQESIENFKVVVAFDRRDYFRQKFGDANRKNYETSVVAGIANNIYIPVYGMVSNAAQLVVLAFGIYLISTGNFTIGLLISYLSYVNRFYDPLRQIASIWATFQVALASFDRISAILSLESDIVVIPAALKPSTE